MTNCGAWICFTEVNFQAGLELVGLCWMENRRKEYFRQKGWQKEQKEE